MCRFLSAWLLATILFCSVAAADYREGRDAANRGDFATAYRIWRPLAGAGSPDAAYSLGRMYARGDGVIKDYSEAHKWFVAAARHQHPEALRSLGTMYEYGDGVPRNAHKAIQWYSLAVQAGSSEAERRRSRLLARIGRPESLWFPESLEVLLAEERVANGDVKEIVSRDAQSSAAHYIGNEPSSPAPSSDNYLTWVSVVFALWVAAAFLLGATDRAVVFFGPGDVLLSFLGVASFIASVALAKQPFTYFFLVLGVLIVIWSTVLCIIHNRNLLSGLFVGALKVPLAAFSFLLLFCLLSSSFGTDREGKPTGRLALLPFLLFLGACYGLRYALLNGERVYEERGWENNKNRDGDTFESETRQDSETESQSQKAKQEHESVTPPVEDEAYFAQVLGLNCNRSAETIKKAYRELVLKYHPDRVEHLGDEFRRIAEEKTKIINKAYKYFEKRGYV